MRVAILFEHPDIRVDASISLPAVNTVSAQLINPIQESAEHHSRL